jgi:hypothetical protein
MMPVNYRYYVRGMFSGPADEKPLVTGPKFLKTLDRLSCIDPLLEGWQLLGSWDITQEDENLSLVPLAAARERIAEIVERGVTYDDFNEPKPVYGYNVLAKIRPRDPRGVTFTASTGGHDFDLSFGDHFMASDLSIVTYPMFKAALLAASATWDAHLSYACASRNDTVSVPIDIAPGVPAFRIDGATLAPLDPTFPVSVFRVPWIAYVSAERADGLTLAREILTERTPDGGLLMSATTERLDPMNREHLRHARIIAEALIACTEHSDW